MAKCALSERQKALLRLIAEALTNKPVQQQWVLRTRHDHGEAVWEGIEDDDLRDELQRHTELADLVALEDCGFVLDIGQQRFSLSVQRIFNAVENDFVVRRR